MGFKFCVHDKLPLPLQDSTVARVASALPVDVGHLFIHEAHASVSQDHIDSLGVAALRSGGVALVDKVWQHLKLVAWHGVTAAVSGLTAGVHTKDRSPHGVGISPKR